MTRAIEKKGGSPGRKTDKQIIEDFLHGLDLPPEVVAAIHTADPRVQVLPTGAPGSASEMIARARAELWDYYKTAVGVAKVQTYREIEKLAQAEADGELAAAPEPLIADIVTGVASLSPVRKRQILTAERERLGEEIAAVDSALASMNEVVAA